MTAPTNLKKVISDFNATLEDRAYRIAVTVGIIVFTLGVLSSYVYAGSLSSDRSSQMESYQKEQADYIEGHIQARLASYEELLIAGAAFHKMNTAVTKSDWQNIYYNLRIPEKAPELGGFGYVEYVKSENLSTYIENTKRLVAPDYMVTPVGDRKEYAPVKLIEPLQESNARALGYDMYSDSSRYEAMIIAKNSGEPALTSPIVAIQDQKSSVTTPTKSLIMYYPVYKEDRIAIGDVRTLAGYSYVIFRVEDVMKKASEDRLDVIPEIYIQDMGNTETTLLYSKVSNTNTSESEKSTLYERQLKVLSRTWTLGMVVNQKKASSLLKPTNVFVGGVFVSLLLGAFLFMVLLKKASDSSRNHSVDLQNTKDELLALASHQLRTPATGVRQYVGMLVEGYFGALNKEQQSIAKRAYSANERQLEIIDQHLYIAKADAGQLVVSFASVDIAKVVKDVMTEYDTIAAGKNIGLFYSGRKKLICSGDKRYIIMIIENLLSNAIKYSNEDTTIRISLKKVDTNVVLTIKDQGIGISEQDQAKLFKKFSRIDSPLSRSEGGSGLGLFLAQKLAESHGGKIVAKSKAGNGSTFIFTLPIRSKIDKNVVQLTV